MLIIVHVYKEVYVCVCVASEFSVPAMHAAMASCHRWSEDRTDVDPLSYSKP